MGREMREGNQWKVRRKEAHKRAWSMNSGRTTALIRLEESKGLI
jgi:hypothetical protein